MALTFQLQIVPVGPTHVAILDPQGNFEPLLYNSNQVYIVQENLVKYLIALLERASKEAQVWSPGEWTVTIEKTAELDAYITALETVNEELKQADAIAAPVSGGLVGPSQPTTTT